MIFRIVNLKHGKAVFNLAQTGLLLPSVHSGRSLGDGRGGGARPTRTRAHLRPRSRSQPRPRGLGARPRDPGPGLWALGTAAPPPSAPGLGLWEEPAPRDGTGRRRQPRARPSATLGPAGGQAKGASGEPCEVGIRPDLAPAAAPETGPAPPFSRPRAWIHHAPLSCGTWPGLPGTMGPGWNEVTPHEGSCRTRRHNPCPTQHGRLCAAPVVCVASQLP
jgi:hypothetical protein